MTTAIAYIRVSTEEQAREGVSIDAQETALRSYCAMRQLDLIDVVVDAGVSAGKPLSTRNGGSRLLDSVRKIKAEAVVSYKLDRLFRDAADCLIVTAQWDKAGVALHLIDLGGQAVDTSTAMGRLFLTIMAGVAEMERNLARERTQDVMAYKRARSEYCGGGPPYGWEITDNGMLRANSIEMEAIREAQECREAGFSLRDIGAYLSRHGYTPRGQKWHPMTVSRMITQGGKL